MQCPECDIPLLTVELDEVEIDYCPECEGVWLDSGELELLTESTSGSSDLLDKITDAVDTNEDDLKCPICSRKMLKVGFGESSDLVLDSCSEGDGYWLNKGELESVLKMRQGDDRVVTLLKDIFDYKRIDKNESR